MTFIPNIFDDEIMGLHKERPEDDEPSVVLTDPTQANCGCLKAESLWREEIKGDWPPGDALTLSVRQPWAWLIIHGGKDIENRDWYAKHRGKVLIHAAKGMTHNEYEWCLAVCHEVRKTRLSPPKLPEFKALERGGIIGSVEIVDCVIKSDSPWFYGRCGFVLRNPQPLPFYQCKGQLGFFSL